MFVKVRTSDSVSENSFEISKLMKIEDFKLQIAEEFSINFSNIRLFYRGKQLEDGYRICHYALNHHDVVQLFINRADNNNAVIKSTETSITKGENTDETKIAITPEKLNNLIECDCPLYRVGDAIDCIDIVHGAWFEAIVKQIFMNSEQNARVYRVQWQFLADDEPFDVDETMIRPRAKIRLNVKQIELDQRIMINYNTESPKEDGYWYDFTVSKITKTKWGIHLNGTLHVASNGITIDDCKIRVKHEIYAIEIPRPISKHNSDDYQHFKGFDEPRTVAISCETCNDKKNRDCKKCGCYICSKKHNPRSMILCDECDKAYHISCLIPPLNTVPDGDWYCSQCKTDVHQVIKAGEKLPDSKKKIKVELKKGQKDWGRGMGCMGKVRDCTIVPLNHRGEIPGIEVGMSWKYRLQVSEAGVHRPHVAGIHGRESECAFSLVLSGGYEDDVDNGEEFIYTGSGGRDLSGNKRTAPQSSNQTLTKMNKALALNCKAQFNDVIGAKATNWRDGIPVRVVRAAKMRKHSQSEKYAPEQGFRYDGIYKVCRYFPEIGKSGFVVWRFVLCRDDRTPAPWTIEGKQRIESLGIQMIDYESSVKNKNNTKENLKPSTLRLKRRRNMDLIEQPQMEVKKHKIIAYKLDNDLLELIKSDTINIKIWDECQSFLSQGKIAFINNVADRFTCACCQEIVCEPITTPCRHNTCHCCLNRSFQANVYSCPICRHCLDKKALILTNKTLSSILERLFPGYSIGRL